MAKIYITNWSDKTAKFGRSSGMFSMDPGTTDYWHIKGGSVYLISPTASSGFHAEEGDRYIVFKDLGGFYRFAYVGKDGYVANSQRVTEKSISGVVFSELTPQGVKDPLINTDEVSTKNDNFNNVALTSACGFIANTDPT